MNTAYKPDSYNSVSPYLFSTDARATIKFLVTVFGATELRIMPYPDGRIMHAEVRIDDTVVMLSDSDDPPATPTHLHVYVPDVDATYRRALEAGATSVQEPVKKDDPDKRGGVQDPGGTIWWIATQIG